MILPGLSHWQHPRFFGYFPSNGELASVLGDYLSTGLGVLGLAVALAGAPGIYTLACDTDGIDGSEDNAGALVGPDTLSRAAQQGIDAKARLADNDAYGFFEALGDLVTTGPTLTNVNDFRAILVDPQGRSRS